MNKEIVLFEAKDGKVALPVQVNAETVWLTQAQMAQLFDKDRTVIGRHIRNAIAEGEIDAETMCAKFAHMGKDSDQTYWTEVYNLDVIISVGYRVHSQRGVEFHRRLRALRQRKGRLVQVRPRRGVPVVWRQGPLFLCAGEGREPTLSRHKEPRLFGRQQAHRGGTLPLLPQTQPPPAAQGWLKAHRRPHSRSLNGDDRRIKARRKGNDGQSRHDLSLMRIRTRS